MSTTTPVPLTDCDSAASVLGYAREQRATADRAEVNILAAAVSWAAMHSVDTLDRAACLPGAEGKAAIAGPGAPLVAEFAAMEFAAALGMSSEAGQSLLGEAVELAHRLPRTWARIQAGEVPAWRGRRIADATINLPAEGAAFVDAHVAGFAARIGIAALDRLIEEARVRFDPQAAEEARQLAADGRRFDVHLSRVTFDGTVHIDGLLDVADAAALDAALSQGAAELRALGSDEPLAVRRAVAAGDLARRQLTLDLATGEETAPEASQPAGRAPGRQVVLHVHLSHAALTNTAVDAAGLRLARVENTRSFVLADQVRTWCAAPDTQITVTPVIDLAEHTHVGAYEIPDRLVRRVRAANPTCVFPWCTRNARRCDTDHVTAYDPGGGGGPTCDCNLAPLCRTHHRAKTHTAWTYTKVDVSTFVWRSPQGMHLLRDRTGTRLLDQAVKPRGHPPEQ